MVDRILGFLERDEEGQLLGIYGAGGVGKSTLVWELNRRLKQTQSPELVICVRVKTRDVERTSGGGRRPDILQIQEDVGRRLGYRRSGEADPSRAGAYLPDNEYDRAECLSRLISEKKCLLILDDVCESIDLRMIGVSREGGNRCKVVLTTRDERVCDDMGVDRKLQFQSASPSDSWALFRETIRRDDLLEQEAIRSRAETVLSKCGGIPRVIVTVARAMSTRESVLEWEVAAGVVDALSAEIGDSGDDMSSRHSGEIARRLEEAARARRAEEENRAHWAETTDCARWGISNKESRSLASQTFMLRTMNSALVGDPNFWFGILKAVLAFLLLATKGMAMLQSRRYLD